MYTIQPDTAPHPDKQSNQKPLSYCTSKRTSIQPYPGLFLRFFCRISYSFHSLIYDISNIAPLDIQFNQMPILIQTTSPTKTLQAIVACRRNFYLTLKPNFPLLLQSLNLFSFFPLSYLYTIYKYTPPPSDPLSYQ